MFRANKKHITMKRSDKDIVGTSFYNHTFKASKAHLIEAIGEPEWTERAYQNIKDKVQNEWVCETENGDVFTIYDWKEYRTYGDDEMIEWHIGGYNGKVTGQAQEEIELLLNQFVL
jgi:hypothetical protein